MISCFLDMTQRGIWNCTGRGVGVTSSYGAGQEDALF